MKRRRNAPVSPEAAKRLLLVDDAIDRAWDNLKVAIDNNQTHTIDDVAGIARALSALIDLRERVLEGKG